MSLIYILGTDKEIKENSSNLNLEEIDITCYKNLEDNKQFLTEKYYYLLRSTSVLGYDIRNIEDFNTSPNKIAFQKFLEEIENLFYAGLEKICLYQFVERDDVNIEENILYETKDLFTNFQNYAEDYFQLSYNIKYRFVYEIE